ncbi:MAG: hypothetical protein LAO05_18610, partial [Acidobacteriia bacterium]|nr:hypothetical protein [Terriglobia bacterium]
MLKTRFSHTPNHVVPIWFARRLGFSIKELRWQGECVYTDQTWLEVEEGRPAGKHPPNRKLQDWAEKVLGVQPG